MESYGAILKKAREDKGLTIDEVARDTTITHQYLEALETEDDAVFPGEPYLVGFLRNYAEYLGIQPDSVISLYKAKTIQESPVPAGLIEKQKPVFLKPLIIGGSIVAAGIIVLLVLLFGFRKNKAAEDTTVAAAATTKAHSYELTAQPMKKRVYKGDQIVIPAAQGKVILTVGSTLGSLKLETPAGPQFIDLSEELELDVDGDSKPELIVYLSDISATDESRGAEVRMMLKSGVSVETSSVDESDIPAAVDPAKPDAKQITILEDTRAYPFTVNASFRGSCIFRYRCDRKEKVEDYFTSGDIATMTASNAIRLWISNNNAVKLQIIANGKSYDLDVGKAGEVQAEDVRWVKDSGKYMLVVTELD